MVKEDRQKKVRKIMNTTLLIMAAGIGSRFGTGIKQLEPDVPGARPLVLNCERKMNKI